MSAIKLIIFDLDGTLIDSLDDLTAAVNRMRADFGLPGLHRDTVRTMVGHGAGNLVARALPSLSAAEVERGLGLFLAYNEEAIADRTVPYPEVRETLQLLASRGMTSVVVSNKNEALCRKVLQLLSLDSYFAGIFGADSFPERKPSPLPLLHVMHAYGCSPAETVIVGDSINDIAAGRAAGIRTVGCTYGYGGTGELTDATLVVNGFAELQSLPLFAGPAQG